VSRKGMSRGEQEALLRAGPREGTRSRPRHAPHGESEHQPPGLCKNGPYQERHRRRQGAIERQTISALQTQWPRKGHSVPCRPPEVRNGVRQRHVAVRPADSGPGWGARQGLPRQRRTGPSCRPQQQSGDQQELDIAHIGPSRASANETATGVKEVIGIVFREIPSRIKRGSARLAEEGR